MGGGGCTFLSTCLFSIFWFIFSPHVSVAKSVLAELACVPARIPRAAGVFPQGHVPDCHTFTVLWESWPSNCRSASSSARAPSRKMKLKKNLCNSPFLSRSNAGLMPNGIGHFCLYVPVMILTKDEPEHTQTHSSPLPYLINAGNQSQG